MMWDGLYLNGYDNQVSCIDREIEALQARKDAIICGYCFTGYNFKPFNDPYGLVVDWQHSIPEVVEEVENYERDSNETEYHNQ